MDQEGREEYALQPYGALGSWFLVGRKTFRRFLLLARIGRPLLVVLPIAFYYFTAIHAVAVSAVLVVVFAAFVGVRHWLVTSGRQVSALPVGHGYKTIDRHDLREWPQTNFWLFQVSAWLLLLFMLYVMRSQFAENSVDFWEYAVVAALVSTIAYMNWRQWILSRSASTAGEPSAFFWLAQAGAWTLLFLEGVMVCVGYSRGGPIPTVAAIIIATTAYAIFFSIKERVSRAQR
jgi:hypothetical protein